MVDTGPAYPRLAIAGSNAIGSFIVGTSPIGDLPAFDVWNTIISEYANSPILTTLITNFFESMDQTTNIEAFYDDIMNIQTAQGYGLDVWGRIVGVSRTLKVLIGDYLGFEEALPGSLPFNYGTFYTGATLTENFQLADTPYRTLIYAKAAANISNGSVPSINSILRALFPNRGNCYVQDNNDMTINYVFNFQLSPVELAIVGQSGALPKPTGVKASVVINA